MQKFTLITLMSLLALAPFSNATTVCVSIATNTHDLAENAQYVKYDYSYTDDTQIIGVRNALATDRLRFNYLNYAFDPGYIASTLYPKCDVASGAVYPNPCANDFRHMVRDGYTVIQPQGNPPNCTPIYYNGVPLHVYFGDAAAGMLKVSAPLLAAVAMLALFF